MAGIATAADVVSSNFTSTGLVSPSPLSGQTWPQYQSCTHNDISKLVEALALAQADFSPLLKDTENPYFKSKYADLAAVIKATLPALIKHGLTIIQLNGTDFLNKAGTVNTILVHKSGQSISSFVSIPTGQKFDAQSLGSAWTYGRRYAYQAIIGVAADIDDDGNSIAAGFDGGNPAPSKPKYEPKPGKKEVNKFMDLVAESTKGLGYQKSPESGQKPTPSWAKPAETGAVPKAQIPNLKPNTNENAKAMFEDHEPTKEEKDDFKKKARLYVQEILPQLGVENPAETLKNFVEKVTGISDTKKLSYNNWTAVLEELDKAAIAGTLKELLA